MPHGPAALRTLSPARGFDIIPTLDPAGQVIASVEQLDMLITNTGADPAGVDDLRRRGIDVLTV